MSFNANFWRKVFHLSSTFAGDRNPTNQDNESRHSTEAQETHDRFCIDISKELIQIIDESWAREKLIPPYHIYIKMAYHLAEEARAGLSEFTIPRELRDHLLEFQEAAVRIAAHHVNKRNGVLIGDVVPRGIVFARKYPEHVLGLVGFLENLIVLDL